MILTNHPGWSWADLEATPARVVELVRVIDAARVARSKADG